MPDFIGNQHRVVEGNAIAADASATFDVTWINYIVNDGAVDLKVNFDASSVGGPNALTIRPGETWGPAGRRLTKLHFSAASSTPFRAFGLKEG